MVLAVAASLRHASRAGVSEAGGDMRDQNHCGGGPGRAAAGTNDDVEEGVRTQEDDEEAIALEVVIVNLRVWRGLAAPRHEPTASVKPPGVFYVTLPPWSGRAGQVAKGAATDPQLRPPWSSVLGSPRCCSKPRNVQVKCGDLHGSPSTTLRARAQVAKRHLWSGCAE